MKLPIKKKWFDKIKNGEKTEEFRDAHITFICEETGEKLRMDVVGIGLADRGYVIRELGISRKEGLKLFEDKDVMTFRLKNPKKARG